MVVLILLELGVTLYCVITWSSVSEIKREDILSHGAFLHDRSM